MQLGRTWIARDKRGKVTMRAEVDGRWHPVDADGRVLLDRVVEDPAMHITGVSVRTEPETLVVEVEVDGHWYPVIRTFAHLPEQTISHAVHASGIAAAIHAQRCQRCKQPLDLVNPNWAEVVSGYRVCSACLRPGEGDTP